MADRRGFSMTEMILVVSILGILVSIAISQFGNLNESSKLVVAAEKAEMLNRALEAYGAVVPDVARYYPAARSDTNDELAVLLTLQFRHSVNPTIGAPYIDPRYRPDSSSDAQTYRIQWTGTMFKMLKRGEAGTGLLEPFDGTDMKTPFPFTDSFHPLGR
jgi:prepilin-type N-terminal cleavage/methylation domain-containing protein